ncbi:hypothetical protein BDY17DRAFT_290233 [Neohortaea acidophila]|uniref:NAD(P)-binding protein n=1 Tax=Neohortaea acidophila TaxID=245834 RepID=A0A6A6Q9K5_9PEZI|nr:uncharacterized protein BDY17DRAFT_290233 [Neohortaea acidophila]KAF2488087.1 hypothetical protein BDY17DRAFT_290233 [Neohortaea acidophila]
MAAKRIVFITGANTGLGYEAVKALYNSPNAYEILLGSRSVDKGETAISTLKKETAQSASSLSTVQVDIESDDSITKAFDAIAAKHGKLDVLINNAGANFERDIQDGKFSLREGWMKSWNVNVAGTNVLTSTFVPLLLKSQDPYLLFITSGTSSMGEAQRFDADIFRRLNQSPAAGWPKAKEPNPTMSYRSTKAGLNMMMTQWERVLKEDGVKVWAISPGFLATGLAGIGAEKLKQIGAQDPAIGGQFIRDVVEGKREADRGKAIRSDMIQPW